MRTTKMLSILALLGVLLGLIAEATAAQRVALVIGNGKYEHAPYLNNPGRDARAVAEVLKGQDFEVVGPLTDLGKADLEQALLGFGELTQGAAAVVVYFAGHGIEVGGQNYLVPVDAKLARAGAVTLEAVALESVLEQIRGAGRYRLVILDACRDNPLANRMRRPDGTRAVYRGLARVEPGAQTYVAYAAKAGTPAQEGTGEHSPHTAALLKYLAEPLPLERLFGAVRDEVLAATQHQQEPYLYGAFGREPIYLSGSPPAPPAAPTSPTLPPPYDADLMAWQSAERCGTAACYRAYLADHPQGKFANLARAQTERLTPTPPTPSAPPVAPPASALQSGQVFQDTLSDGTPGPKMVVIPAGEFWMGSPESEEGRDKDERRHRVKIERAFALGQFEVTVGEFERFIEATGYRTDAERNAGGKGCRAWSATDGKWDWRAGLNWRKPGYEQSDDHPVVCVSWNDAIAYTEWLSKQTRQAYRLPTEAEWEYAARAGTTTARYWGNDPDQACQYANGADRTPGPGGVTWNEKHNCDDGYFFTAPVGRFKPNAWNLSDMLGNVWEWTCSLYDEDYGGTEAKCAKDTSGACSVRGGSWSTDSAWVRSANRHRGGPALRYDAWGFRLARSL